jgi:hypothetical protein
MRELLKQSALAVRNSQTQILLCWRSGRMNWPRLRNCPVKGNFDFQALRQMLDQ